jgi:zinc protease
MLLESRLFDTIRQELGGTYSITASPDASRYPRPEYTVRIDWTSEPARTESLVQRVFQEIAFVKSTRLGRQQMDRIRDALMREYESNSQDNRFWLNQISQAYDDGDASDLATMLDVPGQIKALAADAVHEAAQTYLDMSRYVKVVLMPERRIPNP